MFVPGNNPGMMADAHIYGPDSIMLDLEDSVTMAEKDAARLLVHNALKSIDFGGTEMVVRINPLSTPYGRKDVEAVVKAGVDVIRMPKTETADEVRELEAEIVKVETELGCVGRTLIMAAIESALGVVNAYEIATASKRMMGIALGAEDYSANLKTQRTPEGSELLLARETIVVAARAAGISCFDTVYSNLDDMDTFRKEVELIKNLGFDGKSIINPRQIEVVNEVFATTRFTTLSPPRKWWWKEMVMPSFRPERRMASSRVTTFVCLITLPPCLRYRMRWRGRWCARRG